MKERTRTGLQYFAVWAVVYIVVPVGYVLFLGDFPDRTVLKEAISLLTLVAFFLMSGQFYLSRANSRSHRKTRMATVIAKHKKIGYIFIPLLMLHPFLIVFPRYFEAGVAPLEAFETMFASFGTKGVLLGMIAMVLMLLLGLTSLLRKKMKMGYGSWRIMHGLLSIAFLVTATWHAVDLGRHTDTVLSAYMIVLAGVGVVSLLEIYLVAQKNEGAEK